MSSASIVEVALAIIRRGDQLLISRRPDGVHLAGYWEFPGGKVQPGEAPEACAEREAREELGVECRASRRLTAVTHAYPERTVRLFPVLCDYCGGDPQLLAVAEWRWILPGELDPADFPPANAEIIKMLRAA